MEKIKKNCLKRLCEKEIKKLFIVSWCWVNLVTVGWCLMDFIYDLLIVYWFGGLLKKVTLKEPLFGGLLKKLPSKNTYKLPEKITLQ